MGGAASRSSSEFSEQLLVEGLGESRVVLLRTDWIPFFSWPVSSRLSNSVNDWIFG